MKNKKTFYVTTAIDYVNAEPHIGHAYQKIIADALARWHKILGEDVYYLTGTDEHGLKIQRSAEAADLSPKEFADKIAEKFKEAWKKLNIDCDRFIRTTDKDHEKIVQKFVKKVEKDIYKGTYEGLYCVGCEAYITEKDLVDDCCIYHPDKKPEKIKEETYFFRLSKYEKKLLDLYEKNPEYILPEKRASEIINRVKEGLKDLSITRTNFNWGIPFPLDKKHVLYVWFDALLNYITALEYPSGKNFKKYWPADLELLGVDNSWFHCVIWPAMLLSAGIKPAKTIFVHGFLTFNNQKISKSLGNVISPNFLVDKYGADSIRYFVCRNFVLGEDGDFSEKVLVERHNSELADKLGNLVSRVSTLAEKYGIEKTDNKLVKKLKLKEIEKLIENYEIDKALNEIFAFIDVCNEYAQKTQPWKSGDKKVLYELCDSIKAIAILLWPFLPETSEKIAKQFSFNVGENTFNEIKKPLKVSKIKKSEILFKKIEGKDQVTLNTKNIKEQKINKSERIEGIVKMADIISFNEWSKLDIRAGKILKVEYIEGADKLYKLEIDLGKQGKRILVAGLKKFYSKKELEGKRCIVFCNLEPRVMRGIKSEGMILAAVNEDESKVILIAPEKDIELGSKIR